MCHAHVSVTQGFEMNMKANRSETSQKQVRNNQIVARQLLRPHSLPNLQILRVVVVVIALVVWYDVVKCDVRCEM